jgi:uncharacterized membrane protein YbhN (UPF0104 family)
MIRGVGLLGKLSSALKIVVSAAILLFLFRKANLTQGAHHLSQLRYSFILLSVVLIVIGQVLRAQRLSMLVFGGLEKNRVLRILRIQMVSFLPGLISPAKLGEISKVYMLRSEFEVPTARGLMCFAVERLLDLFLLGPLAAIGLYVFFQNGLLFNISEAWMQFLFLAIIALLGVIALGIILMRVGGERSFRDMWQTTAPDSVIKASVLTLLYWGVVLMEVWCFCKASGFEAEIWHTAMVVPTALLSSMIPISFSGFGLREAAMVILFQRPPIGTSYEQALLIGLMYDIIGLGVPAIMGVLFWLKRKGYDAAQTENRE